MQMAKELREAFAKVTGTQWALMSSAVLIFSTFSIAAVWDATERGQPETASANAFLVLLEIGLWLWLSNRYRRTIHSQPQVVVPLAIYVLSFLSWIMLYQLLRRDLTTYYAAMVGLLGAVLVALVFEGGSIKALAHQDASRSKP